MSQHIIQLANQPVAAEDRITDYDIDSAYLTQHLGCSEFSKNDDPTMAKFILDELHEQFGSKYITVSADAADPWFELHKDAPEAWFADRFYAFEETLYDLSIALDGANFVSGRLGSLIFRMQRLYNDEYDLYVYDDNGELDTFDYFVRYAKPGERYYIGSIFSYNA